MDQTEIIMRTSGFIQQSSVINYPSVCEFILLHLLLAFYNYKKSIIKLISIDSIQISKRRDSW